jgi:hypothetical protein
MGKPALLVLHYVTNILLLNKELCIKVGWWNNSILWCTAVKNIKLYFTLSCYSARNYVILSRTISCSDAAGLFAWVSSLRVGLSHDAPCYRNMPIWRPTYTPFPRPTPTYTQPPSTGTPSSRLSSCRVVGMNLDPFPVAAVQNKIPRKVCISLRIAQATHTQRKYVGYPRFFCSLLAASLTTRYLWLIVFWGVVTL